MIKDKEKSTAGPDVKPAQIVAGALAAVTAAAVGANLGVAGTVIGAGLASVVSTVGATLYQRSIERTSARVRAKVDARTGTRQPALEEAETVRFSADVAPSPARDGSAARRRWPAAVVASVIVFAVGMLAVAGIERVRGSSLSGEPGTTLGSLFDPPARSSTPTQTPTSTPGTSTTTGTPSSVTPTPTTTTETPTTVTTPTSTSAPTVPGTTSVAPTSRGPSAE